MTVELYEELFQKLNEALLIVDRHSGEIIQVNQKACTLYGYSRDEMLGLNASELAAAQDDWADKKERLWTQKASEGGPQLFEWYSKRCEGSLFWAEVNVTLATLGGHDRLLMVVRDISERKQAQAATREMASHLESIGRHFTAGMIYQVISSPNGGRKFTYLSDSVQQLYGISPEEGLRDASLIYSRTHPDDLARLEQAELAAIENLTTFAAEVRNYDASGEVRWSSLVSTPKSLSDGCIRWDGIELTITEQKRLEEQLRQFQKMEAIGSLAGGVAHDFNNLMCVILGHVELAMGGACSGEPIMDDLVEVKRAGARAAILTRQLLAFSRKQVLQPVSLNLNRVAEKLRDVLRRALGETIELVQMLEPELAMVRADPAQLEQVLLNLVTNARDAMPHGGRLTIATSNLAMNAEQAACYPGIVPGQYVELEVTDNGCGMDELTKARIFDPFFTTKGVGKGTGLGLSMVYGVVRQTGGSIFVESQRGQGTTFRIFLPLETSDASNASVRPATFSDQTEGTVTILVAEDEDALRRVVKKALCSAGYQVLEAANGDEAIWASSGHAGPIHLLLTDMVMPRMNGSVLAQRLAAARPELRVLFMSGYADNIIDYNRGLKADTNFLAKPFTVACLIQKVKEVLSAGKPLLIESSDCNRPCLLE